MLKLFNHFMHFSFFSFLQGLTSIKKKPPKSIIRESLDDETEPLQVVTKRCARIRSKVKRRLIAIDSEEEENYEEFAQTSRASNIQKLVGINNITNCESDDDSCDVFKLSTKRNKSENTSTR